MMVVVLTPRVVGKVQCGRNCPLRLLAGEAPHCCQRRVDDDDRFGAGGSLFGPCPRGIARKNQDRTVSSILSRPFAFLQPCRCTIT
jgi:hypothetical protein